VLGAARHIVATALAEGQAIRIEGGHYTIAEDVWECPKMSPDLRSETIGEDSMPGMDGTGPRGAGGGGRCMGGRGRGMGRGQGMGGQGRGTGGRNMGQGTGTGRGQGAGQRSGGQQQIKDTAMGKIAVTTEGPTLDDRVDPRFGRAAGFAIVDPETMSVIQYVDNGGSQAMAQGAGIQAAENVANAGASVLLTGYVGPKAFAALEAAGIAIGQDVDNLTVREAVEKYVAGKVDMADNANAPAGGNK
jgi:predicted Fe-Mo cluster-binding NifX family protein